MNRGKEIENNQHELEVMRYLIESGKAENIPLLKRDDYTRIERLINGGMRRDLAIDSVVTLRKFDSLNIRPKMEVLQGGNTRPNNTFDLRSLNSHLFTDKE